VVTRRQRPFFIFGIAILAVLIGLSLLYLNADKSKMNLAYFSIDLSFLGAIGTMAALGLALIAIGYSIREADIDIFLADKDVSSAGTLQQVRVRNKGNSLGNMTHAVVDIDVPLSSSISFAGHSMLNFQQTPNLAHKQYRLDIPDNPEDLYPSKASHSLLGFIQAPSGFKGKVKFSVRIIGSQGYTLKEFTISI